MAVEGGTIDAGRHIAQHPLYFPATLATAVAMVTGAALGDILPESSY